jgi:hypothetical protein
MQSACVVLFCHLWSVSHCHLILYYVINGTIFGKNVIERKMYVFFFSKTFAWNISHFKENSARYYNKYTVHRSSSKIPVILLVLWHINFLDKFSEKSSNIKFHENPSNTRMSCFIRKDRYEAKRRFSEFLRTRLKEPIWEVFKNHQLMHINVFSIVYS